MKSRSSLLCWEQGSDSNINTSTEARSKSLEMVSMVRDTIRASCAEAMAAWNQTNKYKPAKALGCCESFQARLLDAPIIITNALL